MFADRAIWQQDLCFNLVKIRFLYIASVESVLASIDMLTGQSYRQQAEEISMPSLQWNIRWTKVKKILRYSVSLEILLVKEMRSRRWWNKSVEVERCWCNMRHMITGYLRTRLREGKVWTSLPDSENVQKRRFYIINQEIKKWCQWNLCDNKATLCKLSICKCMKYI